jgi:hypothetical protein
MAIADIGAAEDPPRRHTSRMLVLDDDAAVAVQDAYLYAGLRRAAIYNRWNPKSKYYDPSFPKPLPNTGRRRYLRRGDLIDYAQRRGK